MKLAILGGGQATPPDGWTKETAVAIMGGGKVDLRPSTPGTNDASAK